MTGRNYFDATKRGERIRQMKYKVQINIELSHLKTQSIERLGEEWHTLASHSWSA